MSWLPAALICYGLLNLALGILGYVNSKSIPSLMAGGGAGLIVIACALLAKSYPKPAYIVAAVVCVALLGRFLPKLLQEFQLYPGFIVVAASALMLILLVAGHFMSRPGN